MSNTVCSSKQYHFSQIHSITFGDILNLFNSIIL